MWPRIIIVGLLAVIVGVPLLLRPAESTPSAPLSDAGSEALVIVSPHNEQIRYEFTRAFNESRRDRGLPAVSIDWRTSGGTSDLRRMVVAAYTAEAQRAARENRPLGGVGYDLFFGGGEYEHNILARGISIERPGGQEQVPLSVPIEFPGASEFSQAFPDPFIGSQRLYHPERRWVGAALSSFGIVFNRDLLQMLERPDPETWSDLQHPAYLNQLALADPAHSGSIAATYETIVRRLGWTEGWMLLRRIFANARYFTSSAGKVPVDVSAGEAAAGMCIDFYGRFQAGAIGDNRIGYVDPAFMTAVNADPISILRGAPSQRKALEEGRPAAEGLANQFVLWLLSPPAQELWQKRLGTEGGPEKFELRRLPIRRDLYESAPNGWTDEVNPFLIASPFPDGLPGFYQLIQPVSHAIGIDIHGDLRAAWRAILKCPPGPRRDQMLALFDQLPPALTVSWTAGDPPREPIGTLLGNPDHPRFADAVEVLRGFSQDIQERYDGFRNTDRLSEDRLEWSLFFRDNYRTIVRMGRERRP